MVSGRLKFYAFVIRKGGLTKAGIFFLVGRDDRVEVSFSLQESLGN